MKKRLCRQWKKILGRLRRWLGAGRRDRKDKGGRKTQASKERQLSQEELLASGIKPNTIRLSIGTEHIDDILADLENGFNAVK